jgi:hypothetical protein
LALAVAVRSVATAASAASTVGAERQPFRSSVHRLSPSVQAQLRGRSWHRGCPVPLSGLRLLGVTYVDYGGEARSGQLVVGSDVAVPLVRVFRRLYELRFPIRHMRLHDFYAGPSAYPKDRDITASFECRQAVPSPCVGGTASGHWSNHAYGHAIDLNPVENPYVGCGMTRDSRSRKYLDRSRHLRGMVTPAVVAAFRSIGWGWGGSWSGSTKDYMHFSTNGH